MIHVYVHVRICTNMCIIPGKSLKSSKSGAKPLLNALLHLMWFLKPQASFDA